MLPPSGRRVMIGGQPFTIVGIAPPGFFGETLRGDPPDLWMPLQQEPLINGQDSLLRQSISGWLRAIGRLKPGAIAAGPFGATHCGAAALDRTRERLSGGLDGRDSAFATEAKYPGDCRPGTALRRCAKIMAVACRSYWRSVA